MMKMTCGFICYCCACSSGTSQEQISRSIGPWRPSNRWASLTTMACSALAPQLYPRTKLAGEMFAQIVTAWCRLCKVPYGIEIGFCLPCFRAILKNDWNEVVDLILKPRPGGRQFLNLVLLSSACALRSESNTFLDFPSSWFLFHSRERVSGPVQRGMGQDQWSRGGAEKVAQQALCRRTAASRPVHVWQEKHHHCLWTGWFSTIYAVRWKTKLRK